MKKIYNKKRSYLILAAALLLAVGISVRMYNTWEQKSGVQREIEALEAEVESVKQANQKLEEQLRDMGSLTAQEKSAREERDLQRTGEQVFRFEEEVKPAPTPKQENRKKWIDYLFGD